MQRLNYLPQVAEEATELLPAVCEESTRVGLGPDMTLFFAGNIPAQTTHQTAVDRLPRNNEFSGTLAKAAHVSETVDPACYRPDILTQTAELMQHIDG